MTETPTPESIAPQDAARAEAAEGVVRAEVKAWGVRSQHGEWTDAEAQRHCARDVIQALRAAGMLTGGTVIDREAVVESLKPHATRVRRKESYGYSEHSVVDLYDAADAVLALLSGTPPVGMIVDEGEGFNV